MDFNSITLGLGVTGSVAAIKIPTIIRTLDDILQPEHDEGLIPHVDVYIISTNAGLEFCSYDTIVAAFEGLSVLRLSGIFRDVDEWSNKESLKKSANPLHIEIRNALQCMAILPCSANTLAKLSNGICDNLLTSILRAWPMHSDCMGSPNSGVSRKAVVVFPAMNTNMWEHPITSRQVTQLKEWGFNLISPIDKVLFCGQKGMGALPEPADCAAVLDNLIRSVLPSTGKNY